MFVLQPVFGLFQLRSETFLLMSKDEFIKLHKSTWLHWCLVSLLAVAAKYMPICGEACSASCAHIPDTRTGWLCASSSCRHRTDFDWFGARVPRPHKSGREGAVCHPHPWACCNRHRDTRHLHKERVRFDKHSTRENLSHRWLFKALASMLALTE